MGYKPFKMLGHELPGPNQRSITSFDTNMGAFGPDPSQIPHENLQKTQQPQQNTMVQGQNIQQDQPNNQLITESTDLNDVNMTSDTTKKKVDLEVTVNGQPV